jgi:predicted ATP-binding protein involved in virulence
MKIHLEKAVFINRAPFERLELDFNENEIAVLTAVNGRGKTTIISHIVDAIHEMAKPNFYNSFRDKSNNFYRVSSGIYSLNQSEPSIVYFRFRLGSGQFIDYVDMNGVDAESFYDENITLENKIEYKELSVAFERDGVIKFFSKNSDSKIVEKSFDKNVITYFPSYRYEQPGYITKPYEVKLDFSKKMALSGNLRNPIEVVSGLNQLTNWILDVILDNQYINIGVNDIVEEIKFSKPSDEMNEIELSGCIHRIINACVNEKSGLHKNLSIILTGSLKSKNKNKLRFGIGKRNAGASRIQIMNAETSEQVYPSIFNLSSGEAAVLCLFGEILRQGDNLRNNIALADITGIVLVDEVDKHLHIKLQKEVLPSLFELFPNVQFIVSSHSPFLSMGLAENEQTLNRTKIIDLDNFGISKDPTTNDLYKDVYDMMLGENENYAELYKALKLEIEKDGVPLIVMEGKTDVQHLKKAQEKLGISSDKYEFFEIPEKGFGSGPLLNYLKTLCLSKTKRKIIGIFDRDEVAIIKQVEGGGDLIKDYGSNVFAFCIPVPVNRGLYKDISIEFDYNDIDLKKESGKKRLYFNNEVNYTFDRKIDSPKSDFQDSENKKIEDSDVGKLDWIHSKSVFADLVENDVDFTRDFNFENFNLIFGKIDKINDGKLVQ